jgi:hypothetical protein
VFYSGRVELKGDKKVDISNFKDKVDRKKEVYMFMNWAKEINDEEKALGFEKKVVQDPFDKSNVNQRKVEVVQMEIDDIHIFKIKTDDNKDAYNFFKFTVKKWEGIDIKRWNSIFRGPIPSLAILKIYLSTFDPKDPKEPMEILSEDDLRLGNE